MEYSSKPAGFYLLSFIANFVIYLWIYQQFGWPGLAAATLAGIGTLTSEYLNEVIDPDDG